MEDRGERILWHIKTCTKIVFAVAKNIFAESHFHEHVSKTEEKTIACSQSGKSAIRAIKRKQLQIRLEKLYLLWQKSNLVSLTKKTFFPFLHRTFFSYSSLFNVLSQGWAYFLVCVALRYICWQGFVSKSSVWPCMPDRWCTEKLDELQSLKHCRRQFFLLLINLKLSCWLWYDI